MATKTRRRRQPPRRDTLKLPFAAAALVDVSGEQLLDKLLVEHLSRAAYWKLWAEAVTDNEVLRLGLVHPDASVRATCAQILDHFLDDAAIADIVDALDDEHPQVRAWALHTLGCDRCKEGACRPGEAAFVPAALRMVRDDPSPQVRSMAADTLGRCSARRSDSVVAALAEASEQDPDRHVRRVAARYVPAKRR